MSAEASPLTLNLGAGTTTVGDIRADVRRLPSINVVCDALHLPFKDNSFSSVLCYHLLEHFTYRDADLLLSEIHRVLADDKLLDLVVPNFISFTVGLAWLFQRTDVGLASQEMIDPMLSGEQEHAFNIHLSQWHPRLLKIYIERRGFTIEKIHGEFKIPFIPSFLRHRATVLQLFCRKRSTDGLARSSTALIVL